MISEHVFPSYKMSCAVIIRAKDVEEKIIKENWKEGERITWKKFEGDKYIFINVEIIIREKDLEEKVINEEWNPRTIILGKEGERKTWKKFEGDNYIFPQNIWNRYIDNIQRLTRHAQTLEEKTKKFMINRWWTKRTTRQMYFSASIADIEKQRTIEEDFDMKRLQEWQYWETRWQKYVFKHEAMCQAIEGVRDKKRRQEILTIMDEKIYRGEPTTIYAVRREAYSKQEERKQRKEDIDKRQKRGDNINLEECTIFY